MMHLQHNEPPMPSQHCKAAAAVATGALEREFGYCAGFTTFSSYTLEAVNLLESGNAGTALVYVLGSNLIGLAVCVAGMASIRWVM